mmetsp:Transcript_29711/g.73934  ORF Transcript_29711/g.73934 Transcript_29711/m.73934 type:complete len:629 (-) Transcript_29711:212-2098(-)
MGIPEERPQVWLMEMPQQGGEEKEEAGEPAAEAIRGEPPQSAPVREGKETAAETERHLPSPTAAVAPAVEQDDITEVVYAEAQAEEPSVDQQEELVKEEQSADVIAQEDEEAPGEPVYPPTEEPLLPPDETPAPPPVFLTEVAAAFDMDEAMPPARADEEPAGAGVEMRRPIVISPPGDRPLRPMRGGDGAGPPRRRHRSPRLPIPTTSFTPHPHSPRSESDVSTPLSSIQYEVSSGETESSRASSKIAREYRKKQQEQQQAERLDNQHPPPLPPALAPPQPPAPAAAQRHPRRARRASLQAVTTPQVPATAREEPTHTQGGRRRERGGSRVTRAPRTFHGGFSPATRRSTGAVAAGFQQLDTRAADRRAEVKPKRPPDAALPPLVTPHTLSKTTAESLLSSPMVSPRFERTASRISAAEMLTPDRRAVFFAPAKTDPLFGFFCRQMQPDSSTSAMSPRSGSPRRDRDRPQPVVDGSHHKSHYSVPCQSASPLLVRPCETPDLYRKLMSPIDRQQALHTVYRPAASLNTYEAIQDAPSQASTQRQQHAPVPTSKSKPGSHRDAKWVDKFTAFDNTRLPPTLSRVSTRGRATSGDGGATATGRRCCGGRTARVLPFLSQPSCLHGTPTL